MVILRERGSQKAKAVKLSITGCTLQEDEWQINETYMDNISKYPKDWYKQLTSKKKPKEGESSERTKSDKRRSSHPQDKTGKEAKSKQESSENGDGAGSGSKSDEDKETVPE